MFLSCSFIYALEYLIFKVIWQPHTDEGNVALGVECTGYNLMLLQNSSHDATVLCLQVNQENMTPLLRAPSITGENILM